MKYGAELIEQLEHEIERLQESQRDRARRISNWETDEEDCFLSMRIEERGIGLAQDKIALLKKGGCAWFAEYATLDGELIEARWCNTRYGSRLRAVFPDGSVKWTSAATKKGLAKVGIKTVYCLRPAWFAYKSAFTGLMGAYCGSYELFPSDTNYATGEPAPAEPLEIEER